MFSTLDRTLHKTYFAKLCFPSLLLVHHCVHGFIMSVLRGQVTVSNSDNSLYLLIFIRWFRVGVRAYLKSCMIITEHMTKVEQATFLASTE